MTPAYIHVALCDHDFAEQLEEATRRVYQDYPTCPADEFQRSVVFLTYALHVIRKHGYEDAHVLRYLRDSVVVTYSSKVPDIDHDQASVAVACNTGYIWRY